ncbi:MAG: NlpC/P60 family protein [Pseudomonadota bacterium]
MTALVTAARGWLNTPYVHQGATCGAGCDCLGLIRGVWAEVSGQPLLSVPAYTPDWSEPQGDEALLRGAGALLTSKGLDDAAPGDVIVFRMQQGSVAKHLGLQAEIGRHPTFIHSYQGHGVIENTLSAPWQRRLVARFAFPNH